VIKNYDLINGIVQYNQVISDALPSFVFYPSILTEMTNNGQDVWAMNLPKRRCNKIILHTQDHLNVKNNSCPELQFIENYYKTNLEDIVIIFWNHNLNKIYDGKLKLIEFPTHSFDFLQHLINRKKEWYEELFNRTNRYNFICLNGKEKDFRMKVVNYLKQVGSNYYITHGWNNNSFPDAKYKDYDFDNADNFIKLLPLYRGSNVNIVTETLYNESHGIISEKTLDAFVAMQLPIFVSYKGMVNDLRNYGFDVYDDVIDHSYDTMDNSVRWKAAIDLNQHIINGDYDYESLLPRLKQNQDYIINGYLNVLIENFLHQVNDTIL